MNKPLAVTQVALSTLTDDPANPRLHDKRNIEAIKGSLKEFGQVEPLVVQEGTNLVIGGNGRVQAMRELGWTHADVVRLPLSDARARALSVALNRTSELAEWNLPVLAEAFKLLKAEAPDMDLEALGWAAFEVEPLLAADWSPPPVTGDTGADSGPAPDKSVHTVSFTEDQWSRISEDVVEKMRDENVGEADAIVIIMRAGLDG